MNNDLPNRLFQYEATPPEGVWEKIAASLDEDESYPHRLAIYEAEPPLIVWEKLDASLNEAAAPAKVVPFFVRYKNPLRYVAAASIIAVTLVTLTLTLRQTEAGSLAGTQKKPALPRIQSSPRQNITRKEDAVAVAANGAGAHADRTVLATVKRTLAYIRPQNILPKLALTKRFIPRQVTEEPVADFSALDDFMVYSDEDGTAMRLPKKLFALVNCNDGDGSCRERLQSLRQKLSANIAPSDFTGMLDLVRQLQ